MKRFVLFVMLMMSVAVASAQKWSLTPEIGMMAVKRGGPSYNYEPGQSWNARWKIGVGVEYVVKPDRFSLKSGLYSTGIFGPYRFVWEYLPNAGRTVGSRFQRNQLEVESPFLASSVDGELLVPIDGSCSVEFGSWSLCRLVNGR
jgi:hypothetical protein